MQTYLVSFVYTDNSQAFIELVAMTQTDAEAVQAALEPAQRAGQIGDLYIGRLQATPTPFRTFYPGLLRALGLIR